MTFDVDYTVASTTATTATLTPIQTAIAPLPPSQIVLTYPVSTHHGLAVGRKVRARLQLI